VVVRAHADEASRWGPTPSWARDAAHPGLRDQLPVQSTGAVMPEAALAQIADVAADRGLWLVLDLCYDG